MTERIAGHDFDPITNRCTGLRGDGSLCNMHWLSIRPVTREDIGSYGIAHTAQLMDSEYRQIEGRRTREEEAEAAATMGAIGA